MKWERQIGIKKRDFAKIRGFNTLEGHILQEFSCLRIKIDPILP